MSERRILLVGNPNSGKTTLFNALTGANQTVGNWPGVTVEKREGKYVHEANPYTIIDIPGIYSLDESDHASSLDEVVARKAIDDSQGELILNVVDASNLERNLYLTLQLSELRRPMVVVLNMMDAAQKDGLRIDTGRLAQELGCTVVSCVASRSRGLSELKSALEANVVAPTTPSIEVDYPAALDEAITRVEQHLRSVESEAGSLRARAISRLERAVGHPDAEADAIKGALAKAREALAEDLDIVIADARYTRIRALTERVQTRTGSLSASVSERIDAVVLNRWLGIPIFLAAIYLLFFLTISLGGAFIDFFDGTAGALFVEGPRVWLANVGLPAWLLAVLVDGIGKGLQTVATFIPTIAVLFLFLSFLEDSGYMARAAFVMDRFMRLIGLPGKAFVPLIVGFGCNVPAIMSTRALENERDRRLTVLMSPFMSCSARLPVYAILVAAFFPASGQNVVFSLYLLGVLVALGTGFLLRRSILAGQDSSFILELPPYHIPTLRSMLLRTWDRLKGFVVRAGKVIVVMVAVLGVLTSVDTKGKFGNTDAEKSLLSALGRSMTPLFAPLGISPENWPATVGLMTGVFAKEAVVGTMTPLYQRLAGVSAEAGSTEFSLSASLRDAVLSIPNNLAGLATAAVDPLGLGAVSSTQNDPVAQREMQNRFATPWAAYAFLVFVLLYTPCVAAIGAIHKETGTRWTLFALAWTTGVAYWTSAVFYQTWRLWQGAAGSGLALAVLALTFLAVVFALFRRKSHVARANAELYSGTPDGVAGGS